MERNWGLKNIIIKHQNAKKINVNLMFWGGGSKFYKIALFVILKMPGLLTCQNLWKMGNCRIKFMSKQNTRKSLGRAKERIKNKFHQIEN